MTDKPVDSKKGAKAGKAAPAKPTTDKASEGKGSDASPPDEMGAEDESPGEAHRSADTTPKPAKKPRKSA